MDIKQTVCLSILSAVSMTLVPVLSHAQGFADGQTVEPHWVKADVRSVLEAVGQVTGTKVVIQKGVKGRVTFQSDVPMTLAEFRRAVIAHLVGLGYEVSDRDGVLFIGPRKP